MIEKLESRTMLSASLANNVLSVQGTQSGDRIAILQTGRKLLVTINRVQSQFDASAIKKIIVDTGGGCDIIQMVAAIPAMIDGGMGADSIVSGSGNDTILGGAGNDTIQSGWGDDLLDAEAGQDSVNGAAGDDVLVAAWDNQRDFLTGGAGKDFADSATERGWDIETPSPLRAPKTPAALRTATLLSGSNVQMVRKTGTLLIDEGSANSTAKPQFVQVVNNAGLSVAQLAVYNPTQLATGTPAILKYTGTVPLIGAGISRPVVATATNVSALVGRLEAVQKGVITGSINLANTRNWVSGSGASTWVTGSGCVEMSGGSFHFQPNLAGGTPKLTLGGSVSIGGTSKLTLDFTKLDGTGSIAGWRTGTSDSFWKTLQNFKVVDVNSGVVHVGSSNPGLTGGTSSGTVFEGWNFTVSEVGGDIFLDWSNPTTGSQTGTSQETPSDL